MTHASVSATDPPMKPETPEIRPKTSEDTISAVKEWIVKTDNLTQRKNALWEAREANKTLFPARFNPNDPKRGQNPTELKSGKDTRRVQTPYIYRGSLQITAMVVPEDLTFEWSAKSQVKPPAGMAPDASGEDPSQRGFAETLQIVQRELLGEAGLVPKLRAMVQDSTTYPMAILKDTFRREYQTASLNPNPGDKDASDGTARLQSLITQYAAKSFTDTDPQFNEMKSLLVSLKDKSRISRWWGPQLQLIPMDAFGISEECTDVVNWYDAPYMFHDALIAGEEILARYQYRTGDDGETFGVLESELTKALPWDTNNSSTDPNAKNRSSRNKQLTSPNATAINTVSTTGMSGATPKKRQYVVREIWNKRDRTVYTIIRGLEHYVDKYVPQKTSERWYPFTLLAPNRVPTEVYGVADLELKRDIQSRIHRKRTDEEKTRFLHIPRGIYNRAAGTDEKEMVKMQDIPPGQLRGINFGTTQVKIADMVQWTSFPFDPASYDTSKDEQDLDQMGALPVQSLGQTGSAKFATEVSVASAGSQVAANFRKGLTIEAIDGFLLANAEILIQELSSDEVRRIGGPFSIWPEVYDETEASQIVDDAKLRAAQLVAPQVLSEIIAQCQAAGAMPDQDAMARALEAAAAPVWQAEMVQKYGNIEPVTRESLFRRLKVKVTSSFNSNLDKQQNLQMLAVLGSAIMQIGQACQGLGVPFNPRPILQSHAALLGGDTVLDEAFPAISPLQIAQQLAQSMLAPPAGPAGAPGGQPAPGEPMATGPGVPALQGPQGGNVDPAGQANNALESAPAPMG